MQLIPMAKNAKEALVRLHTHLFDKATKDLIDQFSALGHSPDDVEETEQLDGFHITCTFCQTTATVTRRLITNSRTGQIEQKIETRFDDYGRCAGVVGWDDLAREFMTSGSDGDFGDLEA